MDIDLIIAALCNPTRRQIVHWLKDPSNFPVPRSEHVGIRGICGRDIEAKTGLAQSTTSNYLAQLKRAELIVAERHGQWTFFRRNEDTILRFCGALQDELSPGHQQHTPADTQFGDPRPPR